jgi:hypothetical protein
MEYSFSQEAPSDSRSGSKEVPHPYGLESFLPSSQELATFVYAEAN